MLSSYVNMNSAYLALFLCLSFLTLAIEDSQAAFNRGEPSMSDCHRPKKIAIVGAGIAGVSAAYHLRNCCHRASIEITIHEANDRPGGRIRSVGVYDGQRTHQTVETGAKTFNKDDSCVQS